MTLTRTASVPTPGRELFRGGWTAIASACALFLGCARERPPEEPIPCVVTADIQAGIEAHVEEQIRAGGGRFPLPFDGGTLSLELVRVHTEYLANLGPRRHFACVDLADTDGNVYDVDFFLSGDPGAMQVTETTVHKKNGQPFYAWKQERDRTWVRLPVEEASWLQLGVITGRDAFEFTYRAKVPELSGRARMWIPLATTDAFQEIDMESLDALGKGTILNEREHGNKVLYLELGPHDGGKCVEIRYSVRRLEKAPYPAEDGDVRKFLAPERLAPDNDELRAVAEKIVAGKKGDLARARALYDHVIDHVRYAKFGSGWGQGDAVRACRPDATGNCTDFHSYFISLARSVGIPARFAIGAAIPSERNDGGIDGYHCWAEFCADGKWWPVDISEGDKVSRLAAYYFGRHPANRIEFSRGRDLRVEPGPASGPINFLAYPVLEIDGKPAKATVEFSFLRKVPQEVGLSR